MTIVLFSSLLVCIIAMFLYLNRSITVLKKKSLVITDEVSADISMVAYNVDELKEKARSVERFVGEVHQSTSNKIETITTINKALEHDYTEWNTIYKSFKVLADDLNEKQSHYESLLHTMNLAEKHGTTIHNEIKAFESIQIDITQLKEQSEYTVQMLENKRDEIKEEMQDVNDMIAKEITMQKDNGIALVQREMEGVKHIEHNKIQNELSTLYNTYDKKTEEVAKYIQSKMSASDETIQTLFAGAGDKYNMIVSRMQNDIQRMEQESEEYYIEYTHKIKKLIVDSNATIDESKIVYKDECENIMKETAKGLDEFEARLREVKDSLSVYVESQSDKMKMVGTSSYNQLHENIEGRKESIEKTMDDFIQTINSKVGTLESEIISKISESKQSAQLQYENFIYKTNELSEAGKQRDDAARESSRALEEHIESTSKKLIDDYQLLKQEKEILNSEIYEIKNEQAALEDKIRNQLVVSYEEYTSDTKRYIEQLKHNIQNESKVCIEDIRTVLQNSITEHQISVQNIDEEYKVSLKNKSDDFQNSFQYYQTELWNKIEVYKTDHINMLNTHKTNIDAIVDDTHKNIETKCNDMQQEIKKFDDIVAKQLAVTQGSVDEKMGEMKQEIEGFNIAFAERLEDTGNTIESEYITRLTKRNEVFDEDIKNISTNIQRVDDEHKEFQKRLEEEYLNIRRDADDKKTMYDQFTQTIEQKNKDLSKDLDKTTERYIDFKNKYKEIEKKMLQLQSEKDSLSMSFVEIESIKSTLSSLWKEHKDIKKETEHTSRNLGLEKNKLKEALSDYKHSIKMINQMDDKLKKTNRSMSVIEQQENNIENIKATLLEVQESQHIIRDYQKGLDSWDKDYKMIDSAMSNLLSRNTSLEEKTISLERQLDTWDNKIDSTKQSMHDLFNKYAKLDLVHTEIDEINTKMPEIMDNIDEFKEMQDSFSKQENSMKSSLTEAKNTIRTLGMINNKTGTLTKHNANDSSTLEIKQLVRDLSHEGWDVEHVAETLKISIGEVKLILQKNVI